MIEIERKQIVEAYIRMIDHIADKGYQRGVDKWRRS